MINDKLVKTKNKTQYELRHLQWYKWNQVRLRATPNNRAETGPECVLDPVAAHPSLVAIRPGVCDSPPNVPPAKTCIE